MFHNAVRSMRKYFLVYLISFCNYIKAFRSEVSQIFSNQTLGVARVYYVFLPTLFNYKIVIIKTHEKETSICL